MAKKKKAKKAPTMKRKPARRVAARTAKKKTAARRKTTPGPDRKQLTAALQEIARVASVMFDGELCHHIVTERSWKWMRDADPRERWAAMDNYDLDHESFVAAKKTLMRLEKLAPAGVRVACSLWQIVPTLDGRMTCVIQNGGPSHWQKFGSGHFPVAPQVAKAMGTGKQQTVPAEGGKVLTVVAPVRDSLKDVTGVIEVSALAGGEAEINY